MTKNTTNISQTIENSLTPIKTKKQPTTTVDLRSLTI